MIDKVIIVVIVVIVVVVFCCEHVAVATAKYFELRAFILARGKIYQDLFPQTFCCACMW
jgi:hypothetical protein